MTTPTPVAKDISIVKCARKRESASYVLEKQMLSKLITECGSNFTAKLEGILVDSQQQPTAACLYHFGDVGAGSLLAAVALIGSCFLLCYLLLSRYCI